MVLRVEGRRRKERRRLESCWSEGCASVIAATEVYGFEDGSPRGTEKPRREGEGMLLFNLGLARR